jgi:coenzyme Q-binding protein COQ10
MMPSHTETRRVPFAKQQIFALVADVENYPAFLPRVLASRIRRRSGHTVYVDMLLGFGILRRRIGSVGVLSPPSHIDITSGDPPFKHLGLHWLFKAGAGAETIVELRADFAFRSMLWQRLLDRYFEREVAAMADAFERRARQIYALPPS